MKDYSQSVIVAQTRLRQLVQPGNSAHVVLTINLFLHEYSFKVPPTIAGRLRAKCWPDCAIPDTSMKFGTVVDHD